MENLFPPNKREARLFFKSRRVALSATRQKEAAQKLFNTLVPLPSPFPYVLSFMPIGSEIDITPINHLLAQEGRLLLPKVSGDKLLIYRVENIDQDLSLSSLGIPEPSMRAPLFPVDKISLVLVPALGFDKQNNRLGFGRGYYDRFLRSLPRTPCYGVGFTEQLVQQLPLDPHDLPLTAVYLF